MDSTVGSDEQSRCSLEQAISLCRHVLLRTRREDGLMQRLCDQLADSGFPLVWVGMLTSSGRYGDVFASGTAVDALPSLIPRLEPVYTHLLNGSPRIISDFGSPALEGRCAITAFPISESGRTFAALHVCAQQVQVMNQMEQLAELTDEIGLRVGEIRRLVQTERDLQQLSFRNYPEPTAIIDRDTLVFCDVNHAAIQQYGYSREEFLQMSVDDIQSSRDILHLTRDDEGAWTEFRHLGVWKHRLKDGSLIDMEVSARFIEFNGRPAVMVTTHEVTRWKQMEQALHDSEARFHATFEQASIGIAHLSLEGHFLRVNQYACTFLGYSDEGLLHKTLEDITAAQDQDWCSAALQELLSGTGNAVTLSKRFLRADHSTVWAQITLSLVRDAVGQPAYCVALIKDISTQKWMENSLRDSEMRFRSAFEQAAVGMAYISTTDIRVVRVNRALCDLLQFSSEALLQRQIVDWFHRNDQEGVILRIECILSGQQDRNNNDWRLITRDKQIIWCQVNLSLVRDITGKPLYLYVIVQDISARKRTKEVLDESEMRYRRMIETMQEGVWLFDQSGCTRYVNQRMADLLGYERTEILNRQMMDFVHESEGVFAHAPMVDNRVTETRLRCKDGANIWVILASTPLLDDVGRFVGTLVIVTDIDQRKRMELESVRRMREVTMLYEVGQQLQHIHDPQVLATKAMKILAGAVEYTIGALLMVNEARDRLTLLAVTEETTHYLEQRSQRDGVTPSTLYLDRGVISWVVHNRESMCVGDVRSNPHYVAIHPDIRSELCVPLKNHEQQVIGAINLESTRVNAYTATEQHLLETLAFQIAVLLEKANLMKELQMVSTQHIALSRRLVAAQEYERRQIARELHDQIGQTLTGLSMSLEMSARRLKDEELGNSRRVVDDLLRQVRDLSLNLRPAMLDDLGLLPALLWLCERYEAQTQIRVIFEHKGVEGERFCSEIESAAYRIVQEALTNVARHSGATSVEVRVNVADGELVVQVRDYGRGYDPARVLPTSTGLPGMRARATELGGHFDVHTMPGEGVRLQARFPLVVTIPEEL